MNEVEEQAPLLTEADNEVTFVLPPVTVRICRVPGNADLPLPSVQTKHSAGLDLRAAVNEELVIKPGEIVMIPTGFFYAIPQGYYGLVRPRSGLASKGLTMSSSGVIDSDFRGQLHFPLINLSDAAFLVARGHRIGQMLILPVPQVTLKECDELEGTERIGGFGSTGIH